MLIQNFFRNFLLQNDAAHLSAMAEAQTSVLSSLMLLGAPLFLYFTGITFVEAGTAPMIAMGLMGLLTSAALFWGHLWLQKHPGTPLPTLERVALAAEVVVYINVLTYVFIDFQPSKVFYLVLMPIIFSVSSVTIRLAVASVGLSLATLAMLRYIFPLDAPNEHVRLVAATTIIVVGMFMLFRRVLIRQVRARILTDDYAREMERLASMDPLTGLDNRRTVFKQLDELVASGKPGWLGLLDLNGIKNLNEQNGQKVGDAAIGGLAARLMSAQIDGLSVGRLGGDEFALIFTGKHESDEIMHLCTKLIAIVEQPRNTGKLSGAVSGSIGLVSYPDMASKVTELYEKADFARRKAKGAGRGRIVLFDAREADDFKARMDLEAHLAKADLDAELFLVFQPQVDPETNRTAGFEALVRWNSPELGFVPPDRFIRCAERKGLIKDITRVVLRKGLAVLSEWPDDISLSFNISAQNTSDTAFLSELLAMIRDAGIAPQRVEFEITETAILSDPDAARKALLILAEAGCGIALDDFGIGYSSLQHLRKLPLHKVKIDRSFVRDASVCRSSLEIIAAVIGLCRRLGLNCVLEGVETEAELSLLAPLGPDRIQGYLFGRPMNAEAAHAFIAGAKESPIAAQ
jgi:diguanylate cyclase (GGDEF)-like protein